MASAWACRWGGPSPCPEAANHLIADPMSARDKTISRLRPNQVLNWSECSFHLWVVPQDSLGNKAKTGENRHMDHQPRQKAPRQSIIKAARELFDAKGFHATTSAGLAAEVAVSVGQISRLFERRTISSSLLSRRIRRCSSRRCSSFQRIRRGRAFGIRCDQGDCEQLERQRATAGCPQRFLQNLLQSFGRRPTIALVVCYRDGVRRLAALTRLDATTGELEAYVEIMRRVAFLAWANACCSGRRRTSIR